MNLPRACVLEDYQDAVRHLPCWRRLQGRMAVDFYTDAVADEARLIERLQPYQVVIPIRERTRFPAALLDRLPALRLLALTGRNSGHVDVAAATRRGVLVTETGGSGAAAIEHTIGLILAVVRRIPQEDRALRRGRWQTSIGVDLAGKTLGVVGLGRIGSRVAAFGRFLGMRVLAWGPTLTAERAAAAGAIYVDLEALLRESDVVTLHTRLSDLTRGLIGAEQLALMKPTAYLVNTARGPIVDEAALVAALRDGRLAGAALDVFDREPLPPGHPLTTLDNVVLTPHIGYVTREAYEIFFTEVVDAILAWLDGKVPARAVNADALR
ncbi:MAG TPA: D-2-hydroxyacid dehydrogenase family protein [Candidatus Binatia bacterium]|nr:D-2-hydroxyacid dehydrogenase family protein [Candidatus Binatia bacterium]